MKRLFRWLLRILVTLVIAGLVFYIAVLPGLVERVAISTLEAMGLEDVRLEVRGLSLRHAQLANVAAGKGDRLFVGAIGLRYTLPDLLRGRVDTVELTGIELDVRVRDGQVDLGPLTELLNEESSGEEFPAGRVELRSSTLLLDVEGSVLRFPLRGTVVDQGHGKVAVSARIGRERLDFRVAGTVDTNSMAADLEVHGDLSEMGTVVDALLHRFPGPPWQVGGDLTVDVTCHRHAETTKLALRATVSDVQLGRRKERPLAAANSVQIELEATLEGTEVSAARATVEADGIVPAGLDPIPSGSATLTWDGREASLDAEIGDPFWQCLKLSARAGGVLPWLRGESAAMTADVSWEWTTVLADALWERVPGLPVGLPLPDTIFLNGSATAQVKHGDGGTLSWRVEAPDTRLSLRHDYFGPESLSAELRLALKASPEAATLRVLPDSRMVYHRPSLAFGFAELTFSDAARHALQVRIGGEGMLATARFGETIDWQVSAPHVDVEVSGGQVRASGMTVSDLTATARLSAEATPKGATVTLRSGSGLSVESVRLDDGSALAPAANADGPLVEARVADKGAVLTVQLPKLDWSLSAPGLTVAVPDAILTWVKPALKARAVSLAATVTLEASADRIDATLLPGANIVLGSLETDAVQSEPDPSTPLLRVALGQEPGTLRAALSAEGLDWQARVPQTTVLLALKSVSVPDGPSLTAPKVSLRLGAEATRDKASLTVRDGSHIAFDGVTLRIGGETLSLDAARFALKADAARALAELRQSGESPSLRVAAPVAAEGPVRVRFGSGAVTTVASLDARLDAETDGRRASVKSALGLDGIDASVERRIADQAIKAALTGWSLQANVSGSGAPDSLPLKAEFALVSGDAPEAIVVSVGPVAAALARVELQGEATLPPGAEPRGSATLTVAGGEASHKDAGLTVKGIEATVPLLLGEHPSAHGTFAVESIHVADAGLPGLKGTFESADRQTHVKGSWPVIPGATLSFGAALDFRLPLPRGELTATLPRFAFDDSNQPSALFGVLKGVEVGGAVSLDARVRLAEGLLDPLVTLRLEEVSVSSAAYDAGFEGISTELTFNRLTPLATPGSQRIRMTQGHLGKLRVRDGSIAFRLENLDSLFVERLEWGWAGGRLYTYALRLNPFDPKPDFVLYAERLELNELLALVAEGTVTGTGSLYGRLPVAIDWPKVSYGRGFLYATPGRGRLKFNRATLNSLLNLGHPSLNQVAARSLEEFEYSEFQADFMGEDPDKLARVRAFGKSLSAKHPWEWLLDVRVHGFDRLLNQAIIIKRGTDQFTGSLETQK